MEPDHDRIIRLEEVIKILPEIHRDVKMLVKFRWMLLGGTVVVSVLTTGIFSMVLAVIAHRSGA